MSVKVSEDIENVLNRIFLEGIARKGLVPILYGILINALESLPHKSIHKRASMINYAPFSWKRDNVYVLEITLIYMFSYDIYVDENDTYIYVVSEIAENGIIITETNQFSYFKKRELYESIMRDVAKIVKKAIINQDK